MGVVLPGRERGISRGESGKVGCSPVFVFFFGLVFLPRFMRFFSFDDGVPLVLFVLSSLWTSTGFQLPQLDVLQR